MKIVFLEGIINTELLKDSVIMRIMDNSDLFQANKNLMDMIAKTVLTNPVVKLSEQPDELVEFIIQGYAILFIDGYQKALAIDVAKWNERALEESSGERSIKGFSVGLTEKASTNIGLFRSIMKTKHFIAEKYTLGTTSKTDVYILYIRGTVDHDILTQVRNNVQKLDIKYLLEARIIQEGVESFKKTILPTTLSSERPDVAASALLEGRVVIMVDGTPQIIIAPALFMDFLQSPDEYYASYGRLTNRLFRLGVVAISMFLQGIYVSFEKVDKSRLSKHMYETLLTKDELLPTLAEIFFLNVLIRILLDAIFRIPKSASILISLLGSILVGQTLVEAKLIHPVSIIVVGTVIISGMVVGNKGFNSTLVIARVLFTLIGFFTGLIGLFVGATILILYMVQLKALGVPYVSPLIPFRPWELKDAFYRGNLQKLLNSKHQYPDA